MYFVICAVDLLVDVRNVLLFYIKIVYRYIIYSVSFILGFLFV